MAEKVNVDNFVEAETSLMFTRLLKLSLVSVSGSTFGTCSHRSSGSRASKPRYAL